MNPTTQQPQANVANSRFAQGRPAARTFFALLLGALMLCGCAAQRVFNDAQELALKDQPEAAILKFQEALRLEPNNPEFRLVYERTREKAVRAYLEQADALANSGRRTEAESLYRRVLNIEAGNARAGTGLQRLARDVRHDEVLKAAATDIENGNYAAARSRLDMVLKENPRNDQALAMKQAVDRSNDDKPKMDTALAEIYKRPVSIELRDATLKQVFDVIAQASGLNVILDKDIKFDQRTSILLKNSTVESAIYYMLMVNQLDQQILDSNTLLIYPASSAKQKDYQQLTVKSFMLANASAKSVAETIKTIVKSKDVVVDEKLNMVIVRDSPEAIALAEKLVATQDLPDPEVMLEVEILEISRERLMALGLQWPGSLSLTPVSIAPTSGALGLDVTLDALNNLTRKNIKADIGPFTLKANATDTDSKTLANPRIRVLNRETAKILIGNKVPSVTSTSVPNAGVSQSVTYLDVGLKLEVQPTIYLDNDISIRIGLEVSNILGTQTVKNTNGPDAVTYTIGTRNANTMLRLKDGETQVLAGLISDDDQRVANKFPGLGDFPVLGRLFGSAQNDGKKSEIVLSITPHLIRNIGRPDVARQAFPSGTENSLRLRPDNGARPVPAKVGAMPAPAPVASPESAAPLANSVPAPRDSLSSSNGARPAVAKAAGVPSPAPVASPELPAPSANSAPSPRDSLGSTYGAMQLPVAISVAPVTPVELPMPGLQDASDDDDGARTRRTRKGYGCAIQSRLSASCE